MAETRQVRGGINMKIMNRRVQSRLKSKKSMVDKTDAVMSRRVKEDK
jgi:hypothetical protein